MASINATPLNNGIIIFEQIDNKGNRPGFLAYDWGNKSFKLNLQDSSKKAAAIVEYKDGKLSASNDALYEGSRVMTGDETKAATAAFIEDLKQSDFLKQHPGNRIHDELPEFAKAIADDKTSLFKPTIEKTPGGLRDNEPKATETKTQVQSGPKQNPAKQGLQPTGFGDFTADTRTGFDKAVASFASGPRVGAVYQPDGDVNRITTLSNMRSISPYEQTRSDNASRETNARYIPDQITTKDYKGNDGSITAETEYAKAKERIEKSPLSVRFAGANGVEVLGGGDNKDAAVAGAREAARMAKLDIADFKFSVLKAPRIENGLKP